MSESTQDSAGGLRTINLQGRICKIVVGRVQENGTLSGTFLAHEDVLRGRSKFFEAALSKSWQENSEGKVTLPDADPEIVRIYLHHLYCGALPNDAGLMGLYNGSLDITVGSPYPLLARLYVFGEYVQDTCFKTRVLQAIISTIFLRDAGGNRYCPALDTVAIIYEGTTPGSPARKLMVEAHSKRTQPIWIEKTVEDMHKDFLYDLLRALVPRQADMLKSSCDDMKKKYADLEAMAAGND